MKLRNVWFDFTSILLSLFMLGCAIITITDYVRGDKGGLPAFVLTLVFFLSLSLFFLIMSLRIGKYQKLAKHRKQHPLELKGKDSPT